jgi:ATP-dependent RNA helicase RhlE
MTFEQLELIPEILHALKSEGYVTPTPIQERAIPLLLDGRDILGCAQTGTGKTAAFAIPILQKLFQDNKNRGAIRSLILTPTRELALQIDESFEAYGRNTGLRHTVIFGGVSQYSQTAALKRNPDILVATPGRLLDLMQQGFVKLGNVTFFVLDEADRMLDMGFIHDVKKVLAKLPQQRQNLLFSATMPEEIVKLASSFLRNPARVEVTPVSSTAEKVGQRLYFAEKKEKLHLLVRLLYSNEIRNALVFTRTKHGANKLEKDLQRAGIGAAAIHGNKSQNARQAALSGFKSGETRVLVATDIAARGIDIDELTHVVNYELPNVPETYVHRIGRTGRAGASGIAISFCDMEERAFLKDIEKLIRQRIPEAQAEDLPATPSHALVKATPDSGPPRGNHSRNGKGAPRSKENSRPRHQETKRPVKLTGNTGPRAAQSFEKKVREVSTSTEDRKSGPEIKLSTEQKEHKPWWKRRPKNS